MSIRGKTIYRVLLALMVMSSVVFASSAKLRLSATEVVEGSALEVQIVAEGKDIKFPSIQDIGGFPIEESSVSTKMESTYINGKFSSKNIQTLRFSFYPETDLTIPSFTVTIGGKPYKTQAVSIRVLKPSEVTAKSVDGYSLRIKSNKKRVYVGEPFIVTVDFFEPRNSSVSKVEYTPPTFKAFFSQSLGEEKLKRTATGTLHQLQYLVSAKKEGAQTIMPPKARVGIRNFSGVDRDPWGFFANDIKWQSVRAKPLSIEVKAVPSDVDMVGDFKVTAQVDHTNTKPNAPVTYTLKISGEGNLDDLADPKFDVPGVTVYGDDAQTKSSVVGDKVMSTYTRKYVFISDRDFTIPSMTFKVFDYLSQKQKRVTTKAFPIKISGQAAATAASTSNPTVVKPISVQSETMQAVDAQKEQNKSILEDTTYYEKKERNARQGYPWWSLLVTYLLGVLSAWMAFAIVRRIKQRKRYVKCKRYTNKEALRILYPHTNHHKKVEALVRKLYEIENGRKEVTVDRDEVARIIAEVRGEVCDG